MYGAIDVIAFILIIGGFIGVALIVGTAICILYTIRYGEKVRKDPSKSLIFSQKEALEKNSFIQMRGKI